MLAAPPTLQARNHSSLKERRHVKPVGSVLELAAMTALAESAGAGQLGNVTALTDGFSAAFIGAAVIAAAGALLAAGTLRTPARGGPGRHPRQRPSRDLLTSGGAGLAGGDREVAGVRRSDYRVAVSRSAWWPTYHGVSVIPGFGRPGARRIVHSDGDSASSCLSSG